MRVIRNHGGDRVIDHMASLTEQGLQVEILTNRLSLPAWPHVDALLRRSKLRLLLPSTILSPAYFAGGMEDRGVRSELTLRGAAKALARVLQKSGEVRLTQAMPPQSLLAFRSETAPLLVLHGSCSLDAPGLGLSPTSPLSLVHMSQSEDEVAALLAWFDAAWTQCGPDTEGRFSQALARLADMPTARDIYLSTVLSLFKESSGLAESAGAIKTATGIKETTIWNKLFAFQRDGVVGAIDKLERLGGCIIADSVGLGKTFEALAVIKYYELRNDRVLVLCPKRLRDNWTLYKTNDRRNALARDRFNYDVLNHTDLSRDSGTSGDMDLGYVNWGNYDLVVIDESHNFRNKPTAHDRETRYERLMNRIIRAGVRTKVLMLSATPVNNRLNDLKNQIAFATEGHDGALRDHGITSIETVIRLAQAQFNKWQAQPAADRTGGRLIDMLGPDYFKLLDLLTIARSRRHIERYYGTDETGKFPTRLRPLNPRPDVDTKRVFPSIEAINTEIKRLRLAAYAPLRYVLPQRLAAYEARYATHLRGKDGVFRQADREASLIHLIRMNLLKRMESSVASFTLSLKRQLADTDQLIAKIQQAGAEAVETLSIEDADFDDPSFEALSVGRKIKVLPADTDRRKWLQDLEEDRAQLVRLIDIAASVTPERDAKLKELKALLAAKVQAPLNPGNRKAIIFTAFADTADYLYSQLALWARETLGLHVALVTGTGANRTTLKGIRTDLTGILAAFAPRAKERPDDLADEGEIDLLIATDCISEGQNLQDCDWLANYDIHWNPVRIIQRFGRIDRIGSRNTAIQLVNFWPNMELEEYIQLETRVSGRMVLLDVSATGEENIIESTSGDPMNDLEYRRTQMLRLKDQVIDLEDLSNGLSITDLTFNDFRSELASLPAARLAELEEMPATSHTVVAAREGLPAGAIFCLQPTGPATSIDPGSQIGGRLVVYVGKDGQTIIPHTRGKAVLDTMRVLAQGSDGPDQDLVAAHDRETRDGLDMTVPRKLLAHAVASIIGREEERAVMSLFTPGGTTAARGGGLEDFEVERFMLIRDPA